MILRSCSQHVKATSAQLSAQLAPRKRLGTAYKAASMLPQEQKAVSRCPRCPSLVTRGSWGECHTTAPSKPGPLLVFYQFESRFTETPGVALWRILQPPFQGTSPLESLADPAPVSFADTLPRSLHPSICSAPPRPPNLSLEPLSHLTPPPAPYFCPLPDSAPVPHHLRPSHTPPLHPALALQGPAGRNRAAVGEGPG